MTAPRGYLFIVSGPSGAGKTTLSGAALRAFPDLVMSVSCTTRAPREGEENGREYWFVDRDRFAEMVANDELAEWAEVHGNCYGTPRAPIEENLAEGRDVLLDIDVQGAAQLRSRYPDAVSVFVLPPDRSTMESRLRGRGTDGDDVVRLRLEGACREIARANEYDHVIVNRGRDEAIFEFAEIVREAHRSERAAMTPHRGGMDDEQLAAFLHSFVEEQGA